MARLLLLLISLLISSTALPADKCKLPVQSGPCEAYMPRFYYDAASGQCKDFVYGGCGGNDNRFGTVKECEDACK